MWGNRVLHQLAGTSRSLRPSLVQSGSTEEYNDTVVFSSYINVVFIDDRVFYDNAAYYDISMYTTIS